MDGTTFVLLLMVIIFAGTTINNHIKYKRRGASKEVLKRIQALEERGGSDLEERVRALETIVTDSKSNLNREISSL